MTSHTFTHVGTGDTHVAPKPFVTHFSAALTSWQVHCSRKQQLLVIIDLTVLWAVRPGMSLRNSLMRLRPPTSQETWILCQVSPGYRHLMCRNIGFGFRVNRWNLELAKLWRVVRLAAVCRRKLIFQKNRWAVSEFGPKLVFTINVVHGITSH